MIINEDLADVNVFQQPSISCSFPDGHEEPTDQFISHGSERRQQTAQSDEADEPHPNMLLNEESVCTNTGEEKPIGRDTEAKMVDEMWTEAVENVMHHGRAVIG